MGKWCSEYGIIRYRYSNIFKDPDISKKEAAKALKESGKMFARFTYAHDLKEKTEWWYCLRDTPISLESLTAKQRYRIKKGFSNMEIVRLSPEEDWKLADEIAEIAMESFQDYPSQYRTNLTKEIIANRCVTRCGTGSYWGGVSRETGELLGWAFVLEYENVAYLMEVKVPCRNLYLEVNAALAFKLCEHYLNDNKYYYVLDGERNIRHQTSYQDFLVRVLGFRYSYCKLGLVYKPTMAIAVNILYPFRKIMKKLSDKFPHCILYYNVYCVLNQEAMSRMSRKVKS